MSQLRNAAKKQRSCSVNVYKTSRKNPRNGFIYRQHGSTVCNWILSHRNRLPVGLRAAFPGPGVTNSWEEKRREGLSETGGTLWDEFKVPSFSYLQRGGGDGGDGGGNPRSPPVINVSISNRSCTHCMLDVVLWPPPPWHPLTLLNTSLFIIHYHHFTGNWTNNPQELMCI